MVHYSWGGVVIPLTTGVGRKGEGLKPPRHDKAVPITEQTPINFGDVFHVSLRSLGPSSTHPLEELQEPFSDLSSLEKRNQTSALRQGGSFCGDNLK